MAIATAVSLLGAVPVLAGDGGLPTAEAAATTGPARTPVVADRPIEQALHVADGRVQAITQLGDRIVVGGTFSQVGPGRLGAAGRLDAATGTFTGSFPDVQGAVYAAVPDGAGGWYLGGEFTAVGGQPRGNLARVLADGSVAPWAPVTDGPVRALAAPTATTPLIAGGDFTQVGAVPGRLVALEPNGSVRWALTTDGPIHALAAADGSTRIVVGGAFTSIGGRSRSRLAAVRAEDGVVDQGFAPAVNGTVRALALSGGNVWAAGDFTSVGGATRLRLARFDVATGALAEVAVGVNGRVLSLSLDDERGRLALGGRFGTVGGQLRPRFAIIDVSGVDPGASGAGSATLTPVALPSATGEVRTLAPQPGGDVVLGGSFSAGDSRSGLTTLIRWDATAGVFQPATTAAALPRSLSRTALGESGVWTLAAGGGSTLLVGGDFSDYGLVSRRYLAAYDVTTGALDRTFRPELDGQVLAVEAAPDGSSLYVGGEFSAVSGVERSKLARLNPVTGAVVRAFSASANAYVRSLAVSPDGQSLYIGGAFTRIGDVPVGRLGAVDARSGAVLRSEFNLPLTGRTNPETAGGVRSLALSADGRRLMVIGNFEEIDGRPRPLIAQVDLDSASARVTGWRTDVFDQPCLRNRTGWMRDVTLSPDGSTAYVATSGHSYYPACDTVTSFPTAATKGNVVPSWIARIGDTIEAVAADDSTVYLGGHFRNLDRETRSSARFQLGALDAATGRALGWDPSANGFSGVLTLRMAPAGLLLGGDSTTIGGIPRGRIGVFPRPPRGLSVRAVTNRSWLPEPGGTVQLTTTISNDAPTSRTLTELDLEGRGSLDGVGDCDLPVTIPPGTSWSCTTPQSLTGSQPETVTLAVTARSDDASTARSTATIDLISAPPALRLQVAKSQRSLTFPGGSLRLGATVLNLDPTRSVTVTSLTSPKWGDLSAFCGLPVTLPPDGMTWCRPTVSLRGAIGTRVGSDLTVRGSRGSTALTASAKVSVTITEPERGPLAALVVRNPQQLSGIDTALRSQIGAEYRVRLLKDSDLGRATWLAGASLSVVSPSAAVRPVRRHLAGSDLPTVAGTPQHLRALGLLEAGAAGARRTTITSVLRVRHALAAGQSGDVRVTSRQTAVPWVAPLRGGSVVTGFSRKQATTVAYPPGISRVGGRSTRACRVYLPLAAAPLFAAGGRTLLERALGYATYQCGRRLLWTAAGNGSTQYPGDGRYAPRVGLNGPWGTAVDSQGVVYVVDSGNHAVRRIDARGVVTTVAGTGVSGFSGDGREATAARLSSPTRIAIGPDGSLYVADTGNQRIRRITPDGIITTVAGTGTAGFGGDGGPATAARLNAPFDVAVAGDGTLYIADKNNHRIRRVSPSGTITTVAGTGSLGFNGDGIAASSARLTSPTGVAVATDGVLFVADSGNQRVRRIGRNGVITTVAGTGVASSEGDGGAATEAGLHNPAHVTVAGDSQSALYVSELNSQRVVQIRGGIMTTIAGDGAYAFAGDGESALFGSFRRPSATALAPDGSLWIADRLNHRLRVVNR